MSGLLAMTMLAMWHAKQPEAWHWLGTPAAASSAGSPAVAALRPILVQDEPPPGAFWSQASDDDQPPTAQPPAGRPAAAPRAAGAETPAGDVGQDGNPRHGDHRDQSQPARVDRRLLAGVKDRTGVIPPGAYFHLLDVARRTPTELLEDQQARKNPSLAELAGSPALFRGVAVRIDGCARRVTPMHLGANTLGLDTVYQVDVFSSEFDQNPWVFVVSGLPDGFPVQDHMVESVSVTGYFLKLWAYKAGDGPRFAPLLVGHRLVWRPRAADTQFTRFGYAMIGILLGLIGTFLVVVWWSQRSARRHRPLPPSRLSAQQIETIRQLDNGGPEAALRRLEQAARDEAGGGQL